jgi:hypothetical protein
MGDKTHMTHLRLDGWNTPLCGLKIQTGDPALEVVADPDNSNCDECKRVRSILTGQAVLKPRLDRQTDR